MDERSTRCEVAVGLDLGDRFSQACVVDFQTGRVIRQERVSTTRAGVRRFLGSLDHGRVVLEVGTHSPWVSREIAAAGHEVLVAKAGRLPLIFRDHRKSDTRDAEHLALVGRLSATLLEPLRHRSEDSQRDLATLRARDALVQARTRLINHCRGQVKSFGDRLPACDASSFAKKVGERIPDPLRPALTPLVAVIQQMTEQINAYERSFEKMIRDRYPAAQRLRQVRGVGAITALTFVLTIEDPWRFARPRTVAAYLGLVPRRHASGERDPQLGISRTGDRRLRMLLVECAQYLLGPFGTDCALRRFGERLAIRGGPRAKRRAVVAVARKLSILLLVLWRTEATYEPMRNAA
jgi:transposase